MSDEVDELIQNNIYGMFPGMKCHHAAQEALDNCGISGVYSEFADPADAIRQMARYIKDECQCDWISVEEETPTKNEKHEWFLVWWEPTGDEGVAFWEPQLWMGDHFALPVTPLRREDYHITHWRRVGLPM